MKDAPKIWAEETAREELARAGLLDFAAVMARQDLEAVKTKLVSRQVHCLLLPSGRMVYIKRYFRVPMREALRDRLLGSGYSSGVSRERMALQRLAELKIPAPRPLAAAELSELGLVRSGYLITEALAVERSLESLLYEHEEGPKASDLRDLGTRLALLTRKMHEGGLNHRDFYLGHLMLGAELDPIHVMDLNRADCRDEVPLRWRVKDLAALHVSAPARLISLRFRLRFLRHYLGSRLRPQSELIQAIDRKASKMRRHAENKIRRGAANFHLNR